MTGHAVCFGELLIRLTATGGHPLSVLPELQPFVGGAEANVALGLRRLGHTARMISIVPDNALGEGAIQELRRWGVDVSNVMTGDGRMGLYFLRPGAIHRPSNILYDRADSAFTRFDFDSLDWNALLKGAGLLHVSGITAALSPDCARAALKAMQSAQMAGVRVSFDCNYRAKLWDAWGGDGRGTLRELMHHADIIFGGWRDIELVFGTALPGDEGSLERDRAAADHAFLHLPQLECLTSTRRTQVSADHNRLAGLLFTRKETLESKTYDIVGIVDRIGGGDAFASGVLHGILSRVSDAEALDYGIACGCLKHAEPGDISLASHEDLLGFLGGGGFDVKR